MKITRFGGPGSDEVYRRWIGNDMLGQNTTQAKGMLLSLVGSTIIARNNKCTQAIAWLSWWASPLRYVRFHVLCAICVYAHSSVPTTLGHTYSVRVR